MAGLWPDKPGHSLDLSDMDDIAWMLVKLGRAVPYWMWAEDREESALNRIDTYMGMA